MLWAKKEEHWRVPVKCWASNLEEGAMQQADMLARMPCIFHHVSLMPDCHQGYALPVGGVVAYKNAVSPFGVGSDAGCGMHTFRTNIKAEALSEMRLRREIQNKIKELVPVGESIHDKQQGWEPFNVYQDNGGLDFLVNDRVRKSLG